MCPACLATLAMIVAGATSTGGLAALVVNQCRSDIAAKVDVAVSKIEGNPIKENGS